MRRIWAILKNKKGGPGAFEALNRCIARQTRNDWGRISEFMDEVTLKRQPEHFQPSHAAEIVRTFQGY